MKIRLNFVSNSSSASFVIIKNELSEKQKKLIFDYANSKENTDGWDIQSHEHFINGHTIMDNGAIGVFLKEINIDPDIINYEG
jgi:hypothetical protein